MKTGSLRVRVSLTTLALLAIVPAGVGGAVTLVYRARLEVTSAADSRTPPRRFTMPRRRR